MLAGLARVIVRDTAARTWKSSITSHTKFADGRKAEYEPVAVVGVIMLGYLVPSGAATKAVEPTAQPEGVSAT